MHKAKLMIGNLAIGVALWATAGFAADLTLIPSNVGFNAPIGIDFQETTSKLVLSVNYPLGTPNNLDLADPGTGISSPFAAALVNGLTNELKIATVRASPCLSGTTFNVGEVFTGNGNPGQVIRVNALGTAATIPWVTLTGEAALVRGSLFQDRFNSAGCDLIVVTGNEQTGQAANDNLGNVWRVTSAASPSLVATVRTHLEGVTTVPNVPAIYGPLAGRILAGAEQYLVNGSAPTGYSSYDPAGGQIVAVDPSGSTGFFTIGGPGTVGITGTTHHYITNTAFHPEDLDIIRANADFFGVAFRDGVILEAKSTDQSALNFRDRCGQVLITQEFPKIEAAVSHSGLYALRWDSGSSSFIVDELTANITGISGSQVQQWEHVTFTSGNDCATTLSVAKTPDNGSFKIGDQLTWTIVVTNTGVLTAGDVKLNDQLPPGPGNDLTWSFFSTTAGSCSVNATQLLHCDLGDIAAGGSVTVVVKSSNVGGAPADDCTGVKINNTATASATNASDASNSGDTTCVPPPTGLIAPTETTCQQFAAGTASALGQINYSLTGANKIAQSINPGVFFYYTKITVPANTMVTVGEFQNDAAALFQIKQGQARLYKGDCSSYTTGTEIAGHTGASYTIATAGTYIISIKYDTKSIAGTSAPTSDPVTYTFTATPPGASSSASVLLKKQ